MSESDIVRSSRMLTTMDNSGLQWVTMGNNGQQWGKIGNNGQQWTTLDNIGQQSAVLYASVMQFLVYLPMSPNVQIAMACW